MEATCIDKVEPLSLDKITTLPQSIIENILCLLPIEEAARTSILATEWRYKWTKIPKLVFSEFQFSEVEFCGIYAIESFSRKKYGKCKLFSAIHQVLLQRQGPIYEFTLSMNGANSTCFEIDQIILHLSRNHTLKKLKVHVGEPSSGELYGLPLCVFSLDRLTDLYLENCVVKLKPIFSGFGSLTSLTLEGIIISREVLLHLLSNCPSLKTLLLAHCMLDKNGDFVRDADASHNVIDLFKCLPVIEDLNILCYHNWLYPENVLGELPTSLNHLKYFKAHAIDFHECCKLKFLAVLMKCSPNLEKLKLEFLSSIGALDSSNLKDCSVTLKKYSDVVLERLNELEISYLIFGYKLVMVFVKFILSRSPSLKKVVIYRFGTFGSDEKLEILETLLPAPRPPSAPPVEIILKALSTHLSFQRL